MKKCLFVTFIAIILCVITRFDLNAWEPPLTIAPEGDEIRYGKPVIKVGPDGILYFTYKYRNAISNQTDIFLQTYDGQKMSVLGNINISQNPKSASYEQDMIVTSEGHVHLVWNEYFQRNGANTQHHIMYRFWDGSAWSQTRTLATYSCEDAEDMRLGVSPNGNLHVVWTVMPAARCYLLSLYQNGINHATLPLGGRIKHADLAVDDNFVNVICMNRQSGTHYKLAYVKMENKLNGKWVDTKPSIGRPTHDVMRPRLTIDGNSLLHIAYGEEWPDPKDPKRKYHYLSGTSRSFNDNDKSNTPLFDTVFRVFHAVNIVESNTSVLSVIQNGSSTGGTNIFYDWKKVGASKFPGLKEVPYVDAPTLVSAALSPDGSTAYIFYMTRESSLSLITSDPVKLKPIARGKVDVSLGTISRTVLRTLLFSKVRYNVSWTYVNEDDLATLTAIELYRSPKDQNSFTLLKTLGVNEGTYIDDGAIGSGDTYYDYKVRVLWLDTLERPHYSGSFGNTGLIEETTNNSRMNPQHLLR
jgi:hypothetical protein